MNVKAKRILAGLLCMAMMFSRTPGGLAISAYANEPGAAKPAPVAAPSSSPESATPPAPSESPAPSENPAPSESPDPTESPDNSPDDGVMPMGTEGGTADTLNGDWAYINKFEITAIQDGTGAWDTTTGNGCDENDSNGTVRSFDTVTYNFEYETLTSGEYDSVKTGWLNYEMVLPYPESEAVWQPESMAWVGTKVADRNALDVLEQQSSGYYLTVDEQGRQVLRGKRWLDPKSPNPAAIPGTGTLNAIVRVLAMREGDTLQPTFSAWMENNITTGECPTHGADEVKTVTPEATRITAAVRMNLDVKGTLADASQTVNFDTGSADAPNKDAGSVTGRVESFRIGAYLWNGSPANGRKGLMSPLEGDTLTFDLRLSGSVTPGSGEDISLDGTNFAPMLWAAGSNDAAMDWMGRNTLTTAAYDKREAANTAFGSLVIGTNACTNGGIWTYTYTPDTNIIHVTITGMEIDLNNYPTQAIDGTLYDNTGSIPISTGQLQVVQPLIDKNGTNLMADPTLKEGGIDSGTVFTTLRNSNMHYTYKDREDSEEKTLTNEDQTNKEDDIAQLKFYEAITGPGTYSSVIQWSNPPAGSAMNQINYPADTTGGGYYWEVGGDPAARGQTIGAYFGSWHANLAADTTTSTAAAKCLLKFDDRAVTPTGTVGYRADQNTPTAYARTVLYAAKADGSGWNSDDELETTSMTRLTYYPSIEALKTAGKTCVGVLVEYLPTDTDTYTGISNGVQQLYADVELTVNADAPENELYECTMEYFAWDKSAFEAADKTIPSYSGGVVDLPAASFHYDKASSYNKGTIDPETGFLVGDTGGYYYGDVMQIIAARSKIEKTVAQTEGGAPKLSYSLDDDQRFVDYSLQVTTNYVGPTPQVTPTATLTVYEVMPSGLKYVPGSAYYGGTYTQNPAPGRQGTVTGGTPLTPVSATVRDGNTWYEFQIPDVPVAAPLEPIYLTAEIGHRGGADDVTNGQVLDNVVYSQMGSEITGTGSKTEANRSTIGITVTKLNAASRSKIADDTYIESGDNFGWTLYVGNNGGTDEPDTIALDVFPYEGDGISAFNGTPTVTEWSINPAYLTNFTATNWKIMYTMDENVHSTKSGDYTSTVTALKNGQPCGPSNITFTDITTLPDVSVNYDTGVVTLPTGFSPAAIVMVGTLPAGETLQVHTTMQILEKVEDGIVYTHEQGDILANRLDGYPTPIYTVKRSLEGCTWLDENRDGVRQNEEFLFPGAKVTLYKLSQGGNPHNEDDYQVMQYTDDDGNIHDVAVIIDQVRSNKNQMDAKTGAVSSYEPCRYQFTNLDAGTYAVKFTDGLPPLLSPYRGTLVNVLPDDTRDSDATPFYNELTRVLEKTVILNLTLEGITDSTRDYIQVSRNNDSGFYMGSHDLTISKVVTGNLGDHEKLFDFTVYMQNPYSALLSGTFECEPGVLTGYEGVTTAPEYTSVTFVDGKATLQLKHGQKVTIKDLPEHGEYSVTEDAASATGYIATTEGTAHSSNMLYDMTVQFTNRAAITPSTGILLEVWPYALVVLLALGGAAAFLIMRGKKKKHDDENRW